MLNVIVENPLKYLYIHTKKKNFSFTVPFADVVVFFGVVYFINNGPPHPLLVLALCSTPVFPLVRVKMCEISQLGTKITTNSS